MQLQVKEYKMKKKMVTTYIRHSSWFKYGIMYFLVDSLSLEMVFKVSCLRVTIEWILCVSPWICECFEYLVILPLLSWALFVFLYLTLAVTLWELLILNFLFNFHFVKEKIKS